MSLMVPVAFTANSLQPAASFSLTLDDEPQEASAKTETTANEVYEKRFTWLPLLS